MIFRQFLLIIKACHRRTNKFLLIIFFASIVQLSFAQPDKTVDRLKNRLKATTEDSNKVNVLIQLSYRLWLISKYVEAKNYADEGLVLVEKLNSKNGKSGIYTILGLIYDSQGDYPMSIKWHRAALDVRKELGDITGTAESYGNIGIIYTRLGNYPEALNVHLAALRIWEKANHNLGRAIAHDNIGEVYRYQRNYPEALKYYLVALKLAEELGDKYGIATSKTNVGLIYNKQGNYPEALKYHLPALKIWEEIKEKSGIGDAYINIGDDYQSLGNYPEALKNFLAALNIFEDIGYKDGISLAHTNIGKIYIKQNRLSEAQQYLLNGLTISKEIGAKETVKDVYNALSKLDSAMGNLGQALAHYKLYTDYKDSLLNEINNKQIAQMKEQYESEKKDLEILQLGTDKQKLETEKQISALLLKSKQDSLSIAQAENDKVQLENDKVKLENERVQSLNLYNQQQITLLGNEKQIQQLQIDKNKADYAIKKAEADKNREQLTVLNKEKIIQNLELKKQKQAKNYFIAGLALFSILSFFIYRNYRTRQKLKLQTLRNKIARDLHDDLGSTLSSISIFSQMAQEQSKETIPLLETIGESSRKMLDAMADIVWTINPENDQFEKIILRMRSFAYELLGARQIDFEFVADDDVAKMKLPMEVRKNLYLIFKEATNNLVKYSGANRAFFTVKKEVNNLTMLIRDNGKGFDTGNVKEGNGLINMKKRAGEIGALFSIDSLPGNGTTIQLKVAV